MTKPACMITPAYCGYYWKLMLNGEVIDFGWCFTIWGTKFEIRRAVRNLVRMERIMRELNYR